MKLSEMRELLAERGIQLTKSLGQNFLHDGNQLRRIVEAAELTKADKVLEIGPGLGPLTELLLTEAGEVLAIEKDARLVEVLRERLSEIRNPKSETSPKPKIRSSKSCSMTPWSSCAAKHATGAIGNSSPTCRIPSPHRSSLSWHNRPNARSGWWPRFNSKSPGGSWPGRATPTTVC